MRLREITTSARTSVDHAVDRVANQDQVQAVRRFAKLERVLAGLCLFIPVLLIAFDSGSIRDSISAYFDMDQNQIFYYPLTVAAMLFVVNGVIKHKHSYNAVLGLMLSGVILFNHNDAGVLHTVFTVAFFGGNAVVILLFSEGTLRRYKEIFVLGIVAAMTLDEKLGFRAERHGAVSEGYFPVRETSDIHPDLVEGWVFGRRAFDLDNDQTYDPANFWANPDFEPTYRALVEAELPLFQPIMQSVLQSLGCDPHLFDEKLTDSNLGLRLNYYPPIDDADQASGAGRLLGHEDIDLFTLLPAPAVEGLQALHRNGKWVRVSAPAGSIIMNTGDYMQRIIICIDTFGFSNFC